MERIALVTGAGSGIGRASAIAFAGEGARVVVADLVGEDAERVAEQIQAAGGEAVAVAGDVANSNDAEAMVEVAVRTFGALHVCFNNAGIDLPTATSVTDTTEEDWARVFAVNVTGVFLVSRAALPQIVAAGGGAVINTASVAGLIGIARESAYGASKGAVIALTRHMAMDYAPTVRVNALCPGMVERATRDRREVLDERALQARAALAEAQPLARYGTHEEMARAAVFLASEESSFMTGVALVVDGGMVAR